MENNQHSGAKTATRNEDSSQTFSNSQPGQQLPTSDSNEGANSAIANRPETHSESSQPEAENETLGTP